MSDINVRVVEATIEQAKKKVEKYELLKKLVKNREFKKLILEGYFEDRAIELVSAKAQPNMDTDEMQATIVREIDAIGGLQQWFSYLRMEASAAEKAVSQHEHLLTELEEEA